MPRTKKVNSEPAEVKDVKETAEVTAKAPKAEKAAKKTTAAKPKAAKKTAPAAVEPVIVVEYADKSIDVAAVIEACKAHYKSLGHNTPKKLAVYIKPEDNAAYYTVNGKGSDEYKVVL